MIKSILGVIAVNTPFSIDDVKAAYKITRSIDRTICAIDVALRFNISLTATASILTLENYSDD